MASTVVHMKSRVRLEGGLLRLETAPAARDSIPENFGSRDADFHCFLTARPSEIERISAHLEIMAQNYDLGWCSDEYGDLSGYDAYCLWAHRVRDAAGVSLRAPFLSRVFWSLIPRDIAGPGRTYCQKDGQLCLSGELFGIANRDGGPRPDPVPPSRYGAPIDEAELGLERCNQLFSPSCSGLCTIGLNELLLFGKRGGLWMREQFSDSDVPTLYPRENADALLSRFRQFLPECDWRIVTINELRAPLLEKLLAA